MRGYRASTPAIAFVVIMASAMFAATAQASARVASRPTHSATVSKSAPLHFHVVLIGTSVTYVAANQIRQAIPGIKLDTKNGRGWVNAPSGGGTNLMQAFMADRAWVHTGDWIIVDTSLGGVPADDYATYMQQVIAKMPHGSCLAWVIPHVYFATQDDAHTAVTRSANEVLKAMIRTALATYPCHAFVEWDASVTTATTRTPGLTAAEVKDWQPLCYDGRHPTATGALVMAARMRQAIAHPIRP